MIDLYIKSMGKIFRVLAICKSDDEANEFCRKNNDCGVMAEQDGLIFIAEFYSAICKSDRILD